MEKLWSGRAACLLTLALVLSAGATARADMVIEYTSLVTGTMPSGSSPWLRVTLVDDVVGKVTFKLENLLQSASEFISDVYFNVDETLGAGDWHVAYVSGQNTDSSPAISFNAYNGPGSGKFDLAFEFEAANNANRFTMGEVAQFSVTRNGITSSSFWFPAQKGSGDGEYSVTHVQGIDSSRSGTVAGEIVTVPVPGASMLIVAGIGALSFLKRRLS